MKTTGTKKIKSNGFTSIDLLLGSSLLSTVLAITSQLSNTSIDATNNRLHTSKINSAIASRIEKVREVGFYHLCKKSTHEEKLNECHSNHFNHPKYNLIELRSHCKSNTLGHSLLQELKNHEAKLVEDFNLTDYDESSQSVLISTNVKVSGNQLELSFNSKYNTPFSTTIIPKAATWCA